MKWRLSVIILLSAFLPGSLRAQAPPPSTPAEAAQSAPQTLAPEALNQLLAPIALYPDALIALILPASTVPSDLVLAARYISANGDPAQVANQPWDDSVKSLVRYPDVVKWMDQNLEWTTQVGEAFLDQPADVMNSIQQLRAQAIAAGNLIDTPQQKIVQEEASIRIVPAESEVIYVPQYDPGVVYVQPYAPHIGPAVTFGIGFAVGSWLNYDCDWPRRRVSVGDRNPRWKDDWKRNRGVNINRDTARIWQPSAKIQRQHLQRQRNAPAFNGNARVRSANLRRSDPGVSNLARNLPGEIRNPSFRAPNVGPQSGQTERSSRGDGNHKWKGKGREDSGHQSNANVKRQSLSVREKTWQGDNFQARKWRADSSSVRASRSSNEDQPRAKFKKARSESFHSETEVNKHSRAARIERSRGGARDAAASFSGRTKAQHEDAGGKKGGGRHKSGKKGDGESEKKGKKDKD